MCPLADHGCAPVECVVAHICLPFEEPLDVDTAGLEVIVVFAASIPLSAQAQGLGIRQLVQTAHLKLFQGIVVKVECAVMTMVCVE